MPENYKIDFANSAAREFRDLPETVKQQTSPKIDALKQNPRPYGVTKLRGHRHLYRIKIADYRVVYEINDHKKSVKITRVRHRRDVYR